MEPITHAAIGLAISKITGNGINITNAATSAIVVGAVFPDVDILFKKWGDSVYLKNHRVYTHSIIGLMVSAAFIALVLKFLYSGESFVRLYVYSFIGLSSHVLFDLMNTYGAMIFWPIKKKRYTAGLISVFDPVLAVSLGVYLFGRGLTARVALITCGCYLLFRLVSRLIVLKQIKGIYSKRCRRAFLYPPVTGIFKWHFIVDEQRKNVIGEKSIFKRNTKILKDLKKAEERHLKKAANSDIGKFFGEFTPLYHVKYEEKNGIRRYIFTDMRYYMKNEFLHHAVLELDKNGTVIKSAFCPFSLKRKSVSNQSAMLSCSNKSMSA